MEIVEDRYGRGSTLITSQLPLDKWHDASVSRPSPTPFSNRIVHNAYRLELDGPSMRKLKANDHTEPEARPSTRKPSGA